MTFNDKWNGEFDVKFVKNKGEDEEYYRVWLRDDMIKEFITSRQNSLLDEIVKEMEGMSWEDMKCDCNMCYVREKTVSKAIELLKTYRV